MLGKVSKTKFLGLLLVLTALAVVMACGSEEPTARPTAAPTAMPTAMMEPTATEAMMMEPTATEAMMMEPTATEAMMMEPTATEAMMMEPTATEAMMMEPTATEAMMMPTDSMMMMEKEVIKFHDGQWGTLWIHNAVAMYITDVGYGYPVEEIQGTTGTMQVTLPEGDVHVNMEMWRINIQDWYQEQVVESGNVIDLAGPTAPTMSLAPGSKGQTIAVSTQGIYVPTYLIEGDAERGIEASAPDLSSVLDLPNYKELFADPSDPGKGAVVNCIIGWGCQKIIRAKWYAYDLYADFNVIEPGGSAAIKAGIEGSYEAGEPFLSYYWEPTDVVGLLDLTLLDEPAWTPECQTALDAAVAEEPYESEIGCAFLSHDIHTGVHMSLPERAPEVVDFLGNLYIETSVLATLEKWKADSDSSWTDVAIKFLQENRDVWTTWITGDHAADIIAMVDAELAREG